MRQIRLFEPPSGFSGMPKILEGRVNAVRRVVIIDNRFAGAKIQSIGLVHALGLTDKHSIYRVIRPRGGVNEWIPMSLHKVVDSLIKQVFGASKLGATLQGNKFVPFHTQNGASAGLSSVLDADARRIALSACENFEKHDLFIL